MPPPPYCTCCKGDAGEGAAAAAGGGAAAAAGEGAAVAVAKGVAAAVGKGVDAAAGEGTAVAAGEVVAVAVDGVLAATLDWPSVACPRLVRVSSATACTNSSARFVPSSFGCWWKCRPELCHCAVRAAFRKQFSSKYPIKSLGFPKLWCGLQMERVDGSIRISMKTFTEKLLEKFWQGKVNHSYSPLGMDKLLDEDPPDKDNYPVRAAIGNFI